MECKELLFKIKFVNEIFRQVYINALGFGALASKVDFEKSLPINILYKNHNQIFFIELYKLFDNSKKNKFSLRGIIRHMQSSEKLNYRELDTYFNDKFLEEDIKYIKEKRDKVFAHLDKDGIKEHELKDDDFERRLNDLLKNLCEFIDMINRYNSVPSRIQWHQLDDVNIDGFYNKIFHNY